MGLQLKMIRHDDDDDDLSTSRAIQLQQQTDSLVATSLRVQISLTTSKSWKLNLVGQVDSDLSTT